MPCRRRQSVTVAANQPPSRPRSPPALGAARTFARPGLPRERPQCAGAAGPAPSGRGRPAERSRPERGTAAAGARRQPRGRERRGFPPATKRLAASAPLPAHSGAACGTSAEQRGPLCLGRLPQPKPCSARSEPGSGLPPRAEPRTLGAKGGRNCEQAAGLSCDGKSSAVTDTASSSWHSVGLKQNSVLAVP